eukprot:INCI6249.1.p1 GENE.INCI6249.1~~INCI6249.1.p1  ORF type:complete len:323 (+),score=32.74 INCI6249.1:110-1078(+)
MLAVGHRSSANRFDLGPNTKTVLVLDALVQAQCDAICGASHGHGSEFRKSAEILSRLNRQQLKLLFSEPGEALVRSGAGRGAETKDDVNDRNAQGGASAAAGTSTASRSMRESDPINPSFLLTPSKGPSLSASGISPISQNISSLHKTPTKLLRGGYSGGSASHQSTPGTPLSPGTAAIPVFSGKARVRERRTSRNLLRTATPRTILTEWITKAPTRKMWIIGRLRKHHRRWCVLRTDMRQGAVLVYYDSNNIRRQRKKGFVSIDSHATVVRHDTTTFTLTSAGRTFQGTCDTADICSKWVTEIENCIRSAPQHPAMVRTCC